MTGCAQSEDDTAAEVAAMLHALFMVRSVRSPLHFSGRGSPQRTVVFAMAPTVRYAPDLYTSRTKRTENVG